MIYSISPEHGTSDYYFISKRTNSSPFPHAHSHIEFIMVLKGKISLSVDDAKCIMDANTIGIIMPYQIHSHCPIEDTTTFHIACPPEYINEYNQLFSGKRFSPFVVSCTDAIRKLAEEISDLQGERRVYLSQPLNSFKNKAFLYASLSEFLQQCAIVPAEHLAYDVYRKAIVYITEHYKEDISLTSVAKHCGITAPHLSRIINSQGNTSFSDIVNSFRIFEAKRLLEQTTLPISQIALDSGFGTIRSFNRVFQKYFNCLPRELRLHAQSDNVTPLFRLEPR